VAELQHAVDDSWDLLRNDTGISILMRVLYERLSAPYLSKILASEHVLQFAFDQSGFYR